MGGEWDSLGERRLEWWGWDIRDGDACLLYLAFGRSGAVLGVWGRRRMLVLRSCFCLGDKQFVFLLPGFLVRHEPRVVCAHLFGAGFRQRFLLFQLQRASDHPALR